MQNFARVEGGKVVETFRYPSDPTPLFVPEWIWIEAPDDIRVGASWSEEEGFFDNPPPPVDPDAPPAPEPRRLLQVSPPTFLLLFSSQERIAIRAARKGDNAMVAAVLDDWFSIIEDPRLQYVDLSLPATQAGIDFLVPVGLLTAERAAEIKLGFVETAS